MSTVDGEDLTKTFGDATPYYAVFYDSDGYRSDGNIEVEFNINGVFYKRCTDEYGEASLNINLGLVSILLQPKTLFQVKCIRTPSLYCLIRNVHFKLKIKTL